MLRILSLLLTLIPITHGINCVSCTGWSNSGCNDPYDETTSGDLPVPGNTYCLKVVYPNYIERMAGGRTCTPGSSVGGSVRYCCSNKDYCNRASSCTASLTAAVIKRLTKELTKTHSIKGRIAPFSYVDIGPNLIHEITTDSETKRHLTSSPCGYLPLNNDYFSLLEVSGHENRRSNMRMQTVI
ncbi:unnamed protein product [Rotaria sp. Silwood1]|nr:unnamed protein product [Rotaria sp. Silwood1]